VLASPAGSFAGAPDSFRWLREWGSRVERPEHGRTMKRTFLPLAGSLALLSLAGCATDRQVISQAESTNSELEPAIMEDPELTRYMQEVGARIVAAAEAADAEHQGPKSHFSEDNSWMFEHSQFHLVNSKTLNAFTTGGEHMYVYSQLLEQCRSEDELAAVMAHEYAHVYSRHVHKGMNRQYMALGLSAGAGIAGLAIGGEEHGGQYATIASVSTAVAASFLNLGYTRDDEAEADRWGFYFYTHAGWNPARFGDFFQQLIDQGLDSSSELMSDHPTLASRVKLAKERAAALPPEAQGWRRPPVADARRYAAIKERTQLVAKTMPSDDQVAVAQTLLSAVPSCVLPVDRPEQKEAQRRIAVAVHEASAKTGSN
jgi:predicted Zn-dependent protease